MSEVEIKTGSLVMLSKDFFISGASIPGARMFSYAHGFGPFRIRGIEIAAAPHLLIGIIPEGCVDISYYPVDNFRVLAEYDSPADFPQLLSECVDD